MKKLIVFLIAIFMFLLNSGTTSYALPDKDYLNFYLAKGQIKVGIEALDKLISKDAKNDQIRFSLGVLQFVRAVEKLGQSLYKYGLRVDSNSFGNQMPFLRLPIPNNPAPQAVTSSITNGIIVTLLNDLEGVETTLSDIKSDNVKIPLKIGMAKLDLNGDGILKEDETLWQVFSRLNRVQNYSQDQAEKFIIHLDKGDVYWLRGYCHLLLGLGNFVQAYNKEKIFDHTAHLFFTNPKTPYPYLKVASSMGMWFDLVAFIHLINFPLSSSKRMSSAHLHFKEMVKMSIKSWKSIQSETDNDAEWIPNASQSTVIPGVNVTQDMINGWINVMEETDDILNGRKLIPFWRGEENGKLGINLEKFFTNPPSYFDLVLWVQGPGAEAYLQKGTLTDKQFWNRVFQAFGGQFFGFAVWFN